MSASRYVNYFISKLFKIWHLFSGFLWHKREIRNKLLQHPDYNSYNGVTMMSDLRKLSNHPLLLRYHYQYSDLPEIAECLANDLAYKDTKTEYIIDDLACMSDFEIHTMTKQFSVSYNRYAICNWEFKIRLRRYYGLLMN